VDCYIWYIEEGTGRAAAPPSPLLAVPNVTTHPPTASVPTSCYSTWHVSIKELINNNNDDEDNHNTKNSSGVSHSNLRFAPHCRVVPLGEFIGMMEIYAPGHFPPPDNSLPFMWCGTWCRTSPSHHHHHPPIYNIKQSTANMYEIGSGKSVRVRRTG